MAPAMARPSTLRTLFVRGAVPRASTRKPGTPAAPSADGTPRDSGVKSGGAGLAACLSAATGVSRRTLRQTFVLKLPNFRFAFRGTCHLTFVKLSFFSRCDVVDNGPFWSGPGDGVAIPTLCSGRVVLFGLKGPRPPQKVRISADFRPNLAFEPNPRRNFRFSGRNFRFSAKT